MKMWIWLRWLVPCVPALCLVGIFLHCRISSLWKGREQGTAFIIRCTTPGSSGKITGQTEIGISQCNPNEKALSITSSSNSTYGCVQTLRGWILSQSLDPGVTSAGGTCLWKNLYLGYNQDQAGWIPCFTPPSEGTIDLQCTLGESSFKNIGRVCLIRWPSSSFQKYCWQITWSSARADVKICFHIFLWGKKEEKEKKKVILHPFQQARKAWNWNGGFMPRQRGTEVSMSRVKNFLYWEHLLQCYM